MTAAPANGSSGPRKRERIAYDVTLEAGDAMRRIRDAFADYDGA